MAITPETDTYATLAQADAYATLRSWADWLALTDAAKELALVEAARYLDQSYTWKGTIVSTSQLMAWPRSGAYDRENRLITGLPTRLIEAQIELARVSLSGSLVTVQTGGDVKSVRAGEVSVDFVSGQQQRESQKFVWVNRLLDGLILGTPGGMTRRLVKV